MRFKRKAKDYTSNQVILSLLGFITRERRNSGITSSIPELKKRPFDLVGTESNRK